MGGLFTDAAEKGGVIGGGIKAEALFEKVVEGGIPVAAVFAVKAKPRIRNDVERVAEVGGKDVGKKGKDGMQISHGGFVREIIGAVAVRFVCDKVLADDVVAGRYREGELACRNKGAQVNDLSRFLGEGHQRNAGLVLQGARELLAALAGVLLADEQLGAQGMLFDLSHRADDGVLEGGIEIKAHR